MIKMKQKYILNCLQAAFVLYWTAVFIAEAHTWICIALRKVHLCKVWTYSMYLLKFLLSNYITPKSTVYI